MQRSACPSGLEAGQVWKEAHRRSASLGKKSGSRMAPEKRELPGSDPRPQLPVPETPCASTPPGALAETCAVRQEPGWKQQMTAGPETQKPHQRSRGGSWMLLPTVWEVCRLFPGGIFVWKTVLNRFQVCSWEFRVASHAVVQAGF